MGEYLRILHIGPFKFGTANGLYSAIWHLAQSQAQIGHKVGILRVGKLPSPGHVRIAKQYGVELLGYSYPKIGDKFWKVDSNFKRILNDFHPDIVHLQYVRIFKYIGIVKYLLREKIPYVVSLHGGMNPVEMRRRYWKKIIYWNFFEKYVHKYARAIHFVTENEREKYYFYYGKPKRYDVVIPNPIKVFGNHRWKGKIDQRNPRFVFMGRYDIWHKGIDLLFEAFQILYRDYGVRAELHLFGTPGKKHAVDFYRLVKKYRDLSIIDHGLVEDFDEKLRIMSEYDFYIQYSRFELFGMSIVEALSLGMPVIISEGCDLAAELSSAKAGFIISLDPLCAAKQIRDILAKDNICSVAQRGYTWVRDKCDPAKVATSMSEFYQRVVWE